MSSHYPDRDDPFAKRRPRNVPKAPIKQLQVLVLVTSIEKLDNRTYYGTAWTPLGEATFYSMIHTKLGIPIDVGHWVQARLQDRLGLSVKQFCQHHNTGLRMKLSQRGEVMLSGMFDVVASRINYPEDDTMGRLYCRSYCLGIVEVAACYARNVAAGQFLVDFRRVQSTAPDGSPVYWCLEGLCTDSTADVGCDVPLSTTEKLQTLSVEGSSEEEEKKESDPMGKPAKPDNSSRTPGFAPPRAAASAYSPDVVGGVRHPYRPKFVSNPNWRPQEFKFSWKQNSLSGDPDTDPGEESEEEEEEEEDPKEGYEPQWKGGSSRGGPPSNGQAGSHKEGYEPQWRGQSSNRDVYEPHSKGGPFGGSGSRKEGYEWRGQSSSRRDEPQSKGRPSGGSGSHKEGYEPNWREDSFHSVPESWARGFTGSQNGGPSSSSSNRNGASSGSQVEPQWKGGSSRVGPQSNGLAGSQKEGYEPQWRGQSSNRRDEPQSKGGPSGGSGSHKEGYEPNWKGAYFHPVPESSTRGFTGSQNGGPSGSSNRPIPMSSHYQHIEPQWTGPPVTSSSSSSLPSLPRDIAVVTQVAGDLAIVYLHQLREAAILKWKEVKGRTVRLGEFCEVEYKEIPAFEDVHFEVTHVLSTPYDKESKQPWKMEVRVVRHYIEALFTVDLCTPSLPVFDFWTRQQKSPIVRCEQVGHIPITYIVRHNDNRDKRSVDGVFLKREYENDPGARRMAAWCQFVKLTVPKCLKDPRAGEAGVVKKYVWMIAEVSGRMDDYVQRERDTQRYNLGTNYAKIEEDHAISRIKYELEQQNAHASGISSPAEQPEQPERRRPRRSSEAERDEAMSRINELLKIAHEMKDKFSM